LAELAEGRFQRVRELYTDEFVDYIDTLVHIYAPIIGNNNKALTVDKNHITGCCGIVVFIGCNEIRVERQALEKKIISVIKMFV
jgi:hypothetical protein